MQLLQYNINLADVSRGAQLEDGSRPHANAYLRLQNVIRLHFRSCLVPIFCFMSSDDDVEQGLVGGGPRQQKIPENRRQHFVPKFKTKPEGSKTVTKYNNPKGCLAKRSSYSTCLNGTKLGKLRT